MSDASAAPPDPEKPCGVILAGGLSSRMGGGDKSLLLLDGRTLIDHVAARLAPQCARLALNANGDPSRFASLRMPVIADPVPEHPGPLAGILAGMEWAVSCGHAHIVTAAADTPFLPHDLVSQLSKSILTEKAPIVLAATPGDDGRPVVHPTFGMWPVALRHDLRAALAAGTRRVRQWAEAQGAAIVLFPADPFDPFLNVNTPADLATARAMIRNPLLTL